MNRAILFITKDNINPLSGGIDRITYVLATELRRNGCACFSAYLSQSHPLRIGDAVFDQETELAEDKHDEEVVNLIELHKIDVIIVQGVDALMNKELISLRKVLNTQTREIPLLFVFHQMPGYELVSIDNKFLIDHLFSGLSVKEILLQILLRISKKNVLKSLRNKYIVPYQNADRVILLSRLYIDDFCKIVGNSDTSKYLAIPNMLTFPHSDVIPSKKERIVLMVARMDEQAKRIKRAIEIWSKLPMEFGKDEWRMVIVGNGKDLTYYKNFVKSRDIKNVSFEGQQDPLPYYQAASIFMMTSAFEGWPMTLMEAMQNGCVPIVFDSFKAVYDIIENGKDGIIVPDGNKDAYLNNLVQLMQNAEQRKLMSEACVERSQQFSQERITKMWLKLFENVCKLVANVS